MIVWLIFTVVGLNKLLNIFYISLCIYCPCHKCPFKKQNNEQHKQHY